MKKDNNKSGKVWVTDNWVDLFPPDLEKRMQELMKNMSDEVVVTGYMGKLSKEFREKLKKLGL